MKRKLKNLKVADWMLELRPIDSFVVARYRQAWRQGAEFPPLIVDGSTMEIISGNHRYLSALAEFGEDYAIEVHMQSFVSAAAKLVVVAEENAKHGAPMDGITRRRLACAMIKEGMTSADVGKVMNVAATAVEKWGTQSVLIIGSNDAKPVKCGIDTSVVTKMSKANYEEHMKKDLGIQARGLMRQLERWLNNGWIDLEDERTKEALADLKEAMK